jgi:predicted choloylglycine hydrolase
MADKVFVNDEILLILSTQKVLTIYTIMKIKFEKPNGVKGSWPATIHPTINTKMYATVYFDMEGIWKVQAFVSDGTLEQYHGMWVDVKVYEALAPDTTSAPTTASPP